MATFPFSGGASGPVWQQADTYRDAKGNVSTFRYYINTNASAHLETIQALAITVQAAYAAMSNAAFQSSHGLLVTYGVAQYGSSATAYESVIQKAILVFQDTTGQLHRYAVMAPKLSIFKLDKITVDPANAAVATFVAAFANNTPPAAGTPFVVSRQNLLISNYMGGVFAARKIRRRANILVLEPDLTGGLPEE